MKLEVSGGNEVYFNMVKVMLLKSPHQTMIKVPFYWLDVFTSQQFKGNMAAVYLMKTDYVDKVYQSIATELKLSKTAFNEKIKVNEYKLR